ncbi:MAG: hypothetical protein AAF539_15325 [Planctomycetota bacterium]
MSIEDPNHDDADTTPDSTGQRRDETLVVVAERPTEGEAMILVHVLQDAGIDAVAVGGFTAGFRAEAPGWVQVKTFQSDAESARQVIAEIKRVDPE